MDTGGFVNRRSFLKMLGAAILTPFLPKVKRMEAESEEEDPFLDVYLPRNTDDDGSREIVDFCYGYPTLPEITEDFIFSCEQLSDDEKRQTFSDFLMSLDCSSSEGWSLREPCEVHDLSETVDPLDAYVKPYPTLAETLEEIRRVCLDRSSWGKPIEYTYIMSPEQFDWYCENVPWFPPLEAEIYADEHWIDPAWRDLPTFDEVNAKLIEMSGFSLEPPELEDAFNV